MSIVDHAKEIAELIRKYNDQELYQKIVDLRDEIFELREDNLTLREKLREIEQAEDVSEQLLREGNAYFRKHPDGTKSGPYCLACWDGERKLINLQVFAYGVTHCGHCDKGKPKK